MTELDPTVATINTVRLDPNKYAELILSLCASSPESVLVGKKKLFKLLYFCDFDMFEFRESCLTITGDKYRDRKMGPVPEAAGMVLKEMNALNDVELGEHIYGGNYSPAMTIKGLREPNLGLFSADEKFVIDRVIHKYGRLTGAELETLSHAEAPWVVTDEGELIPFGLALYRGTEFASVG